MAIRNSGKAHSKTGMHSCAKNREVITSLRIDDDIALPGKGE